MLPPADAHSRGTISFSIVLDSPWKYKIFDFGDALSVYEPYDKIYANIRPSEAFMKKYKQPILLILVFILFCTGVFLFTRNSETLSEYAERKPEIAYAAHAGTKEPAEDPSAAATAESNVEAASSANHASPETATVPAPGDGLKSAEINQGNSETDLEYAETDFASENNPKMETAMEDRVTYQPDFYYESLSDSIKKRITGLSYKQDCTIPYEDLRYVRVLYTNFNGGTSTGELICNQAIARDLVEIFYELYQAEYRIESIRLIDEYNADDLLSMEDNNTSCFNYRTVEGTTKLSKHAQGLAIDINPFFNPYITYENGKEKVSPADSEAYADRSKPFAYKIDEHDLCYKLFTEHGFIWGGHWNSCKDYQHFQKNP